MYLPIIVTDKRGRSKRVNFYEFSF